MLNFQEFQEYVEMNLKEVLSEEYQDAVVSLNEVTKNNGTVLHAVTVRPEDSNIAPNIYLDGYFKKYEEGADIDIVMGEIGRVAMDNMRAPEGRWRCSRSCPRQPWRCRQSGAYCALRSTSMPSRNRR